MLRKIYLIAALVLTSSLAMAQSGTLKGVISDAMSGEPIPFANIIIEKNGNSFSVGTSTTLGKIAQAYSQHVKKLQVPFVFEGVEIPATNIGKQIAAKKNFIYPIGEWDDLRSWKDIVSD